MFSAIALAPPTFKTAPLIAALRKRTAPFLLDLNANASVGMGVFLSRCLKEAEGKRRPF